MASLRLSNVVLSVMALSWHVGRVSGQFDWERFLEPMSRPRMRVDPFASLFDPFEGMPSGYGSSDLGMEMPRYDVEEDVGYDPREYDSGAFMPPGVILYQPYESRDKAQQEDKTRQGLQELAEALAAKHRRPEAEVQERAGADELGMDFKDAASVAEDMRQAVESVTDIFDAMKADLLSVRMSCSLNLESEVDLPTMQTPLTADDKEAMKGCMTGLVALCGCVEDQQPWACVKRCWMDKEKAAQVVAGGCGLLSCHLARLQECGECYNSENLSVDMECVHVCHTTRGQALIDMGCKSLQCAVAVNGTCRDGCVAACEDVCEAAQTAAATTEQQTTTVETLLEVETTVVETEMATTAPAETAEERRRRNIFAFYAEGMETLPDSALPAVLSPERFRAYKVAWRAKLQCLRCQSTCVVECRCDNRDVLNGQGCAISEIEGAATGTITETAVVGVETTVGTVTTEVVTEAAVGTTAVETVTTEVVTEVVTEVAVGTTSVETVTVGAATEAAGETRAADE